MSTPEILTVTPGSGLLEATTSDTTSNEWENLKSLIQVLEQAGIALNRIKDITTEFLQLVEASERFEDRQGDYEAIKQELETCFRRMRENFAEPTRLRITECIKGLCRDIKIELVYIRQQFLIQPPGEHEDQVDSSCKLLAHYRRIQALFQGLLLNTDPSTWGISGQDIRLETLALASGSCSSAPTTETDSCVSLAEVRRLRSWMQDNPHGTVYWVPYARQTGISRLLCAELNATHKLGASCFSPRSCGLDSFISAIAYQLADYSAPFRLALLSSQPQPSSEPLEVQFEQLIVKPLTRVRASLPGDLTVIIDGTNLPGSVHPILNALLAAPKDSPVKFIIFSRPEAYHDPLNSVFVYEVSSGFIIEGVEGELEVALKPLGLSGRQVTDFVQRTATLFAFAAAAAHYVGDDNWSNSLILPQSAQI
ncbi:unnamed protein product [Rhizoctonia solani]|uniref:Uncharacterized protein n=1 Tax=Rhizoctonia solani TaxID=456999 RepID=A0A8H2WXH6_9AGAM|nr:unnamed protein product [Rhizoctonia solani]